jgi:hypothetical protein
MHKPAQARLCRPLAMALVLLSLVARAEETEEAPRLEDFLDAPPPPEVVRSGEPLEPPVTIVRPAPTVQDFQRGGRPFMIKVTPTKGPAYYLIDQDGDGRLETRADSLNDPLVPNWIIFSW